MKELFIFGDPRFLSGGLPTTYCGSYEGAPMKVDPDSKVVTSATVARNRGSNIPNALASLGQDIHRGKHGYHDRPPFNVFLRSDDELPSVGVELETVKRGVAGDTALVSELVSNWFHFERDGSLPSGGYECITDPLGPRHYRDPKLWIGLQNVLAPWVYSWDCSATGLHVHVGISRFETLDMKSAPEFIGTLNGSATNAMRKALGRFTMMFVYYSLVPRSFIDAVFMRPAGDYRNESPYGVPGWRTAAARSGALTPTMLAFQLVDQYISNDRLTNCISHMKRVLEDSSPTKWDLLKSILKTQTSSLFITDRVDALSSHSTELNMSHSQTLEFRHGKGTVNGTTIHKIVEFAVFVEQFAERILSNPSTDMSASGFLGALAEWTTSPELANLANDYNQNIISGAPLPEKKGDATPCAS